MWLCSNTHYATTWETQEVWLPLSPSPGQGIVPLHRVSPPLTPPPGHVRRDRVPHERRAGWKTPVTTGGAEGRCSERCTVWRQPHESKHWCFCETSDQELLTGDDPWWWCSSKPTAAVSVHWQPGVLYYHQQQQDTRGRSPCHYTPYLFRLCYMWNRSSS